MAPDAYMDSNPSTAVFSMNGPHFGDRYGIASELLSAFEENRIDLLSLSCTIASISGVVPSSQLEATISTIEKCFEVPAVIRK
jgi:aspartokinase